MTGPCLVRENAGEPSRRYPLEKRVTTVGSDAANQLCFDHPTVIPHHGYLVFQSGECRIRRLSDAGAILVNGADIHGEQPLKNGDRILFGKLEFRFFDGAHDPESGTPDSTQLLKGLAQERDPETFALFETLFHSVLEILRQKDSDNLLRKIVVVVAKIMKCDGVNLIRESEDGQWNSLAVYPMDSSTARFSSSAIRLSGEEGRTVLLSRARLDNLPMEESIRLNHIHSVLCSPISIPEEELPGYLYMDRLAGSGPFSEKDRALFDVVRELFGELIGNANRFHRQREAIEKWQNEFAAPQGGILFKNEKMETLFREATRLAKTDVPVLVHGETGTGKELLAQHIHQAGTRAKHPFVAVNCGAIPESLMERELFGHEKGAFTGAGESTKGLVEAADKGTLFLDEIGELPLEMQVKLLRVLQEGQITRVGGTKPINIDFRLLSATHRNLKAEVDAGRFRADLFYRLNVVSLEIPPLRQRPDDVLLLANHFLKLFSAQYGTGPKYLGKRAEKTLQSHAWPGNVRELENCVQKAVILSTQPMVQPEDLGFTSGSEAAPFQVDGGDTLRAARERAEKETIIAALQRTQGNISLTARVLDVDRKVLTRLVQRLQIEPKDHKSG